MPPPSRPHPKQSPQAVILHSCNCEWGLEPHSRTTAGHSGKHSRWESFDPDCGVRCGRHDGSSSPLSKIRCPASSSTRKNAIHLSFPPVTPSNHTKTRCYSSRTPWLATQASQGRPRTDEACFFPHPTSPARRTMINNKSCIFC